MKSIVGSKRWLAAILLAVVASAAIIVPTIAVAGSIEREVERPVEGPDLPWV